MSVDYIKNEYSFYLPEWTKIRDFEDSTKVKAKGELYLKRLNGHKQCIVDGKDLNPYYDDAYLDFKDRAIFYEAIPKTESAWLGHVYRKSPIINGFDETDIDNVTLDGKSLNTFGKQVLSEAIKLNRVGLLVDYFTVSDGELTIAEAEQLGERAYLSSYCAESIINWNSSVIGGEDKLTLVVLKESVSNQKNEYDTDEVKNQYRVLKLVDGFYVQELYNDAKELVSSVEPRLSGQRLNYIPFYFADSVDNTPRIKKSLLSGIAEINGIHYKDYADYQNGLHWIGAKTLFVSGANPETPIFVGGANKLDDGGKAELIEASSDDGCLQALKHKEELMASLGANGLGSGAIQNQTATASVINQANETGMLVGLVKNVSKALTEAVSLMLEWNKQQVPDDFSYSLNTDFNPNKIDPQTLNALMQQVQSGLMSLETYYYNLEKGEMYPEGHSFEKEKLGVDEYKAESSIGGMNLDV